MGVLNDRICLEEEQLIFYLFAFSSSVMLSTSRKIFVPCAIFLCVSLIIQIKLSSAISQKIMNHSLKKLSNHKIDMISTHILESHRFTSGIFDYFIMCIW